MIKDVFLKLRERLTVTAALELMEATAGRKVSRLGFSENHIPWLDELISQLGAYWVPAYAPFQHTPDLGKGEWASLADQNSQLQSTKKSWQIFISNSLERACSARDMESRNDERTFGASLGIPKCCIDFYLRERERARSSQNDFTLLSASETGISMGLPIWTNTLTQYFGTTLLSFAPCSYQCEAAIRYARERYAFALEIDVEMAKSLVTQQKTGGFYTEFEGVHLFRLLRYDGEKFEIESDSLKSTIPGGSLNVKLAQTRYIHAGGTSGLIELEGQSGHLESLAMEQSIFFDFSQES